MTNKQLKYYITEYAMDIKSFISTDIPAYKLQTELME